MNNMHITTKLRILICMRYEMYCIACYKGVIEFMASEVNPSNSSMRVSRQTRSHTSL